MNKLKTLKMKAKAALLFAVLVGVVGVGFAVKAFTSDNGVSNVFENVGTLTLNQAAPENVPGGEVLGALTGPDIPSPYLTVGGLQTWYRSMSMVSATNTVCALQAPATTSTLTFLSAVWDVSSSTASVVTLAKSATAFVTTTQLGVDHDIAANAKSILVASSTALTAGNIFAPNQYAVIGMKGGTGTFSPTGYCKAEFKSAY